MAGQIQNKLIEEEMKESYIDYAMSVITSRALPNVYDGLKPVQRRILYIMHKLNLLHSKPYRKSAHVIGNVMARVHPHGDLSIYEAMGRMAQDFSLRYPLIDGQGNWGSVDGDNMAASRYTEARLAKIAEELLVDIDKETVEFIPNYDNSSKEPVVLPAKLPNLLINGSSGIAVGMATNIPPHNIGEIADAIVAMINNPEIGIDELINIVKGPDFPTGGLICGLSGVRNAYKTGRGKVVVRAYTDIEEFRDRKRIVIYEIPYQVNKSMLIENIANLVRDKVVEGISDVRDESDREGMRIVIELKQGANPGLILNKLYKHSELQSTFGVIMLALVNGEPKILNLREIISYFILHRKNVVTRRTRFELNKAEQRAHILEGLKVALDNIDEVVRLIKKSKDVETARIGLTKTFKLTEVQTQAILDMRLQRLTSLEVEKIKKEHEELLRLIKELKEILADERKIYDIIKKELLELKGRYNDDRRTDFMDYEEMQDEDLIKKEEVVVTMTHAGYIKRIPLNVYKQQRRGGKGMVATGTKEEDFVEHLFITNSHNYILFFTNKGRVYWLKAYRIPESGRYTKGGNIVNILNLKDEEITAFIPVDKFDDRFLVMATRNGLIKKTRLKDFSRPRNVGIIALKLRDSDSLVNVALTDGNRELVVATENGMAVRFKEENVREMGRNAIGVRAIKLINDKVIGMEVSDTASLLTITENGYGKRSKLDDYRLIKRGGKGVRNIKTSDRNGKVVGIRMVREDDDIMFITKKGMAIRTPVKGISVIGRNTQGVRVMRLESDDKLVSIGRVVKYGN